MKLNAIIEKAGTEIRLISVFENTLAGYGVLSVSREYSFNYRINSVGAFPLGKVFLPNPIAIIYPVDGNPKIGHATFQRNSPDYIDVFVYSSDGFPIEDLTDWTINVSIETYP